MKKSKKYLMALAICSLSVVAIGCSSNEKKNTSNGTTETTEKKENKETKEDKTEKLSNEEIVKKLTESSKLIKSSKVKVENKIIYEVSDRKKEISSNFDIITSSNPTIVKITGKVRTFGQISFYGDENKNGDQDINIYHTEDAVYIFDIHDKKWLNVKDEEAKKELQDKKDADRLDVVIKMMNDLTKYLKIEEKESEYEVTFLGTNDYVKESLKKALMDNKVEFLDVLDDMKLDTFKLEYKLDKETFMPKEQKIEFILKKSTYSSETIINFDINTKYSEINKVEPITIPDEVKNAEEWKEK